MMCTVLLAAAIQQGFAQTAPTAYLHTPWTKEALNSKPLNDYPRPQMVRSNWENLNGMWQYCIQPKQSGMPVQWQGHIRVPFPLESPLSGVQRSMGPDSALWYRRSCAIKKIPGKRVLLHIGAADYEATVYVNGQQVMQHQGGYTSFSADITPYLKGAQEEIVIRVWDPTDQGEQPRGKQTSHPGGIYYTAVTGIWQTVWYETVEAQYVQHYAVTADIDHSTVTIRPDVVNAANGDSVEVQVFLNRQRVALATAAAKQAVQLTIPEAQWWSPDHPVLYDFFLHLKRKGKTTDEVKGYFGMRKIEIARDEKGINRIFFNHQPLFQYGPLDQGFWPDGIYTAPAENALLSDIRRMKEMGFNMVRKHVKVEPDRWYYHCDRLGLIVWQDMPSGYGEIVPVKDHDHSTETGWMDEHYKDVERSPASEKQFREEWSSIIHQLYNFPSVAVWVPFNESWGQFKTNEILRWTKQLDPSRLVDGPSGWIDRGEGDMHDYHLYGDRLSRAFRQESNRALVVGEFGGLGYLDSQHVYKGNVWSYNGLKNKQALLDAYRKLVDKVHYLKEKGFSAAVYTQLTDVETEINGLLTYDRAEQKIPADNLLQLHRKLCTTPAEPRVAHRPDVVENKLNAE